MRNLLTTVRRFVGGAARHTGRRGGYLGFLSLVCLSFGWGLLQPLPFGLSRDTLYEPFLHIAPLPAWSMSWLATGGLSLVATVWHAARPAAFGLATLLMTAWSLGYLNGWWEGLPAFTRGYQTAATFIAFGLVTLLVSGWRENDR